MHVLIFIARPFVGWLDQFENHRKTIIQQITSLACQLNCKLRVWNVIYGVRLRWLCALFLLDLLGWLGRAHTWLCTLETRKGPDWAKVGWLCRVSTEGFDLALLWLSNKTLTIHDSSRATLSRFPTFGWTGTVGVLSVRFRYDDLRKWRMQNWEDYWPLTVHGDITAFFISSNHLIPTLHSKPLRYPPSLTPQTPTSRLRLQDLCSRTLGSKLRDEQF